MQGLRGCPAPVEAAGGASYLGRIMAGSVQHRSETLPGSRGQVFPVGTRLNEAGRLEVGGCDLIELAREFGTPAYVYAEDDIRARARAYLDAFKERTDHFEIVYASKAFPCTAAYRLLAEEGLACDVASGGELHMALRGGFAPERIYLHGNNKSEAELEYALEQGVGHIIVDSLDELERLERVGPGRKAMLRVTPRGEPNPPPFIAP